MIGLEFRNVIVLVGEVILLKCFVYGNFLLIIMWVCYGIGNGLEFFFFLVKFFDSGWYRCVVINIYGVFFSLFVYFDVIGKVFDFFCGRIKIVRF